MSWDIEMAKMIKEESKAGAGNFNTGAIIGVVVSSSPAQISILDGAAMLQQENLYLANGSTTFNFQVGHEVLLIQGEDPQTFFIVNRAIKL
ncbi:hypothetical protein J2Z35_001189 [Acetoanaerobium pronyense]|uniref:DUF2577 domain-containing protein n=1 Tax=Acetoanaerobium pronyense TaxID=1482736 RepID=A0ABS4KI11_9FIRM|nr:hypothetical protein [Acetoanaerobium pronyense]MBP2027395.1 hypothetical protein [Acetoanaerobium pronyense]